MSPSGLSILEHLTEVAVELYERQFKETAFLYGLCDKELVLIIQHYFQDLEIADLMKREPNDKEIEKSYACKRKHVEKSEKIKQNVLASNSIIYSCDICKEEFTQRDDLVHHKTTHSEETKEKRFKTEVNSFSGEIGEESFTDYNILTHLNHSVFDENTNQIQEIYKETTENMSGLEFDPHETVDIKEEFIGEIENDPLLLSCSYQEGIYSDQEADGQGEEKRSAKPKVKRGSGGRPARTCDINGCRSCKRPKCGSCKSCLGKRRCDNRKCDRFKEMLKERNGKPMKQFCPKCGLSFNGNFNLNKHLERGYCGYKSIYSLNPVRCNPDFCGLVFAAKSDRYIHQVNSENPELHKSFEYQCPECDKWLKPKSFKSHLDSHKKSSEIKKEFNQSTA